MLRVSMVLDGIEFTDVDSNLKTAMKKGLGDTIGVHWSFISTPEVGIYISQERRSRGRVRALSGARTGASADAGGVSPTVFPEGLSLRGGVRGHRGLASSTSVDFDISTNAVSDSSAFLALIDTKMKASLADGSLLGAMQSHAKSISSAYEGVLNGVSIASGSYSISDASPTLAPTPFLVSFDDADLVLVGSNALAILMLTIIGLLFIVMTVFVLHALGVKIPWLSAKLHARNKVAPAPTATDKDKDKDRQKRELEHQLSPNHEDPDHDHEEHRLILRAIKEARRQRKEMREAGQASADHEENKFQEQGGREGERSPAAARKMSQVVPMPMPMDALPLETPDAKHDEVRLAAATTTPSVVSAAPEVEIVGVGAEAASHALEQLYRGKRMATAFHLRTSPQQVADDTDSYGSEEGSLAATESKFNAHVATSSFEAIDFAQEAILSGSFENFTEDYLILLLSAVEYEQTLREKSRAAEAEAGADTSIGDRIAFEISVTDTSGAALQQQKVMERILSVYSCPALEDGGVSHVKFIVTADAPLFVQKSYVMPRATFIVGGSTLSRLLSEEALRGYHHKKMANQAPGEQRDMALRGMASNACHFVVAGGRDGLSRAQCLATLDGQEPPLEAPLRELFHLAEDDDEDENEDEDEGEGLNPGTNGEQQRSSDEESDGSSDASSETSDASGASVVGDHVGED